MLIKTKLHAWSIAASLALAALLLVACKQENEYTTTRQDTIKQTTIKPVWYETNEQVNTACINFGLHSGGLYNGCAKSSYNDVTVCEIHMVRPKSFDDKEALQVLGHETWHCLGARHE